MDITKVVAFGPLSTASRLLHATFHYENGASITIEGHSMTEWLSGYLQLLAFGNMMEAMQKQQHENHENTEGVPRLTSDAARQRYNDIKQRQTLKQPNKKDEESE